MGTQQHNSRQRLLERRARAYTLSFSLSLSLLLLCRHGLRRGLRKRLPQFSNPSASPNLSVLQTHSLMQLRLLSCCAAAGHSQVCAMPTRATKRTAHLAVHAACMRACGAQPARTVNAHIHRPASRPCSTMKSATHVSRMRSLWQAPTQVPDRRLRTRAHFVRHSATACRSRITLHSRPGPSCCNAVHALHSKRH